MWCKQKNNPAAKYASLANGMPLSGHQLNESLQRLFELHAANASSLCHGSSTNGNESFNTMVAAKAPKARHYSKLESLNFRVACAVNQKTIGENYVLKTCEKLGVPCAKSCQTQLNERDLQSHKRKNKRETLKYKRRRMELKEPIFLFYRLKKCERA